MKKILSIVFCVMFIGSLEGVFAVEGEPVEIADPGITCTTAGEGDNDGSVRLADGAMAGRGDFNVWRPIGAILFVLCGLMALAVFLRRRYAPLAGVSTEKRMRLIEGLAIDHRRRLLLVEVDGKSVLIGVGPERVEPIAVLDGRQDR